MSRATRAEAEHVKKPDPEIFHIAAHRLWAELAGGWMVGDHPSEERRAGWPRSR